MAKKKLPRVRITLQKSPIGNSSRQKKTIEALGLKRVGQVAEFDDSKSLRGMLDRISHLVHIEDVQK